MKKHIVLLSFMISMTSFAQTITSKNEIANVAQYELLKKINEYYPDISLNEKVVNFYIDNKIIDTKQEFDIKGTKFTSYKLSIDPDNKRLLFEFISTDNGKIYGEVTVFKGKYFRTTFDEKNARVDAFIDGKVVYSKKI